jgi:hypothetical protein
VKAQELAAADARWENDKVKKWLEKKKKPRPTTIERQLRSARREFANIEKLRVRPTPATPTRAPPHASAAGHPPIRVCAGLRGSCRPCGRRTRGGRSGRRGRVS